MNLGERKKLRLRLRDLSAFSAFLAVALSGSLPIYVVGLFIAALILSFAGKRPFAGRAVWSVIVLLGAALVLFGLAFRGLLDLVIAAVAFATLVTGHRMLSEPTATTDQQVLLASLLLMAGAAALSGDIWYALCLLAFGVFACLTLGLAVVEGPQERDEELPLSPVLKSVSIGVFVALLGGVVFFILFPRLSWNVASRNQGPGLLGGTTGMTDRVRLGGGGDIKTSARIVLRAKIEPKPRSERLDRYWTGRHFDVFDGKEWRGSGEAKPASPRVMLGDMRGATETQRIELLPAYDSRTLVGLSQPLVFGPAYAITTGIPVPAQLVEADREEVRLASEGNAFTYTVISRDDFEGEPETPERISALSRLPETLDPRVTQLAAQIAGDETEPRKVANKLERWLRSNLEYSLELSPSDDPLADFLFNRKAGHCEHFATALAVMLRTRKIPARVVGGFFGGELVGNRYIVRAGDAHAWVEAYDPVRGWMTFDATPESGRGSRPPALLSRLVDAFEELEELWRSRVVDYSFSDQWGFVRDLIRPPRGSSSSEPEASTLNQPTTRRPTRALFVALGAGALVWLVWRRLSKRTREHPATAFGTELERKVDALKLRGPDEELEALTRRLVAQKHPIAAPLDAAVRRYLEARFGGRPLSSDERRTLLARLGSPRAAAHT